MSIDSAVASNWVLEKFSATADGFNLLGTTKGYASFARAFQDGTTVFYAASDDDGNREAGWGVYRGNRIVDRTPTATLTGTVYSDNNPSPLTFSKGGQIGGTFNALAFNTLWNRKGAGMVISATEPTDVETGMQWLDSTTAKVWIWDEDKWLEFPVTGSGGVGSTVQIEEWPPTTHKIGDTWVDYGTTGELYVWDGRFWVSMTGDGGPKVIIGDGEGGLPPNVELPENITFDQVESAEDFDQALARFIDPSNTGKWGRIKTSDILTNPDVTFRDANGRFKSTKDYEGLTDQLKVNRFLANEIELLGEEIDGIELPETDLSDYAKTEYVDAAVEAEKVERSLADIALRDSLQAEIDAIEIPEVDLDGYATEEQLAQVNEASEFRDDALSDRITELEKEPEPVKLEGTLRWVDYTYNSDTIDALYNTIRVHTDRTKMSINWDTIEDGRKNWANLIDGSVGLEVEGTMYWATVEYVGEAGTSGRGKNFKILDHNIPPAGEIAADSITGIYPNYLPVKLPAGTHVGPTPPADPEEGVTWYDTVRLELFVYAEDAWLPCSPLGARVEQGEAVQAQIIDQIKVSLEEQASLRNRVAELDSEKATIDYVDERDEAVKKYTDDQLVDAAKKSKQNTFKEIQTFEKSTYFQNICIHNGKNTDTVTEVRGDHEDGTKQLWWKIRGTNRVSWICYPGQENRDYKKCLEMEWDADAGAPLVKLDYLQPPTKNRHAATKQYVDDEIAKSGGGSFAEVGPTTPSLSAGQLFYNTTDKVLYIGE